MAIWQQIIVLLVCVALVGSIGGLITKLTWTIYLRNSLVIKEKKDWATLLTRIEWMSMVTMGINYMILVYLYNSGFYNSIPTNTGIISTTSIFLIETLIIEIPLLQRILNIGTLRATKMVLIGFLLRYTIPLAFLPISFFL